jgi:hypothetical protein
MCSSIMAQLPWLNYQDTRSTYSNAYRDTRLFYYPFTEIAGYQVCATGYVSCPRHVHRKSVIVIVLVPSGEDSGKRVLG